MVGTSYRKVREVSDIRGRSREWADHRQHCSQTHECQERSPHHNHRHTVREALEDTGKEPFAFLAQELGIFILCICATGFEFGIRYSEDTFPFLVSQRDVYMPSRDRSAGDIKPTDSRRTHYNREAARYQESELQRETKYTHISPWLGHEAWYDSSLHANTLRKEFEENGIVGHP